MPATDAPAAAADAAAPSTGWEGFVANAANTTGQILASKATAKDAKSAAASAASMAQQEARNADTLSKTMAAQAQASNKGTGWALPAIIGVVALGAVLFFVMRKRKKG